MGVEAILATWPAAETAHVGGFALRRGSGGGNRTSAATLIGADGDVAAAEAAMRAWGQRPLFLVRAGETVFDAVLAARGYAVHDATLILSAPVAALARPGGETALLGAVVLRAMADVWAAGGIGPDRMAVMARAPGPKSYLLARLEDRVVGAGFVACTGATAVLHALEVTADARRRGLGARMAEAAAAWAAAEGAATLELAVTRANAAALALYARLGMAEAGAYHYRVAPA